MVRREGTRFGINTNHNVRRLPFPYKNVCAQQNVVIETKLDAEGHQSKKQAKMTLKKQLQKDTFNTQPDETSQSLRFSLNKAKRWEVIEGIKEEYHHDNHYIIQEHHMLQRSSRSSSAHTCVEVFDSSAEHSLKSPKKKYTKATDLIKKDQNEKVREETDFGKKNCKRSRKRRARQEEEVAGSLIQYDVTRAAPRETYQTYSKSSAYSDFKQRNTGSRNRSKKLQQCRMNDVFCDGVWQLSEFSIDEEEEEYCQEETPFQVAMETREAEPYEVSMETLVSGSMSLSTEYYLNHRRPSQCKPEKSTKDRVFPIDTKDAIIAIHPEYIIPVRGKRAAKKRLAKKNAAKKNTAKDVKEQEDIGSVKETVEAPPPTVLEKPSVVISVQVDDITEENLRGRFGDCFIKGQCIPPRFAINISDSVIEHLASNPGNAELSTLLQQTGHHIFTILECSLDPWQVRRDDGRLVENIRMKLSGVDEEKETLSCAVSGLKSDKVSDIISAISQSVALLPADRYLVEKEVPCYTVKSALAVGTVQTTLGWQYHTTNANKALQTVQSVNEAPESCMVSQGASNTCESCSICYEKFDEDYQGTALTACNHWFCDECWRNHLITQINQGNIHITCPEYKCTTSVDKVTLMSMVPSKFFSRYHANQTNSALMLRSELHWCPSPACGRLWRLSHTKRVVSVNCDCGTFWCSGCKEEAHWPATCQQAKIYRQKAKDLFKKKDYMIRSVSAKPCPRCHYPIEKWYGCNHMECKCGFSFCWECGKDFNSSHYHCLSKKWTHKVYLIQPEDIVGKTAIELAMLHHKERTSFACHRRIRKVKKLATKMLKTEDYQPMKDSEKTSSVTMVTDKSCQLKAMRKLLLDVANFLSEAEFVLEHLEILLSSHESYKRALSEHKTRLIFITEKLHKIFKQGTNLIIADVEHLLICGKDCLRWIALSTTQLNDRLESTEE